MLKGDIEIFDYFIVVLYLGDEFVSQLIGITIQNSYRTDIVERGKFPKKFRELIFAVNIFAVPRDVLSDENKFFHVAEALRFRNKVLFFFRAIFTSYRRDKTISTMVIAPVGDFKISVMKRGCYNSFLLSEFFGFADEINALALIIKFDRFREVFVISRT